MRFLIAFFALVTIAEAQPTYQPHAIWQREGAGDSSLYGTEILALGDQNNDGYNDWAVFASGWGPAGQINEAKIEFFHGGNPQGTTPYMVRVLDTSSEASLRDAYTVGDLNDDGFVDWIIVAQRNDGSFFNDWKVYFGGPGTHNVPDLILTSAQWQVGYRGVDDFNGDGFDDLLFGGGQLAAVIYGGNPMDSIPDWTRTAYFGGVYPGEVNDDRFSDFVVLSTDDNVDLYLGGEHPDTLPVYHWNEYISSPAILPDVNGDDIGDLAFGVAGGVEIRFGGSAIHATSDAFLHFPGCSPHQVVSAGDFNLDGFHDVVMVTEYCADSWYGKLAVHLGGSHLNVEPAFVVEGWTEPFNLIGIRTACNLGDINGDGDDDLAVGANSSVPFAGRRGKVVVFAGDSSLHAAVGERTSLLPENLEVSVFPNPFNSSATVKIDLPSYRDKIDLTLYNVLGQVVQTAVLRNVSRSAIYTMNGSSLSTGLYLLRAETGRLTAMQKLVVLK